MKSLMASTLKSPLLHFVVLGVVAYFLYTGLRPSGLETIHGTTQDVTRAEDSGFVADALWTVSGSVNHFGHTHYRRNRYQALLTFVGDGDAWKIRDIELIEEQRLL